MEVVAFQIELRYLIISDHDACRIRLRIQFTPDLDPGLGRHSRNQVHDHGVSDERFATPVLANVGKQPMLALVPLTGSRRQMTYTALQSGFIGEFLEFDFPQMHARPIAAPTVGGNQHALGIGVAWLLQQLPPASNVCDGKGSHVVIDSYSGPAQIVSDIVHTIQGHLTEFRDHRVMHTHRFRFALWTQFTVTVLEVVNQFLLLGIYRNDRLSSALEGMYLRIDVLELGVPISVCRPLTGLPIGLQALDYFYRKVKFLAYSEKRNPELQVTIHTFKMIYHDFPVVYVLDALLCFFP